MRRTACLLFLAIFAIACGGEPTQTPATPTSSPAPSLTAVPATETPASTATPEATATPRAPTTASPTPTGEAGHLVLVHHAEGGAETIFVRDNYAYVADDAGRLRVLDVSQPAAPTEAGVYEIAGFPEALVVAGNYAYVADGNRFGLHIIDVSDPTSPTEVGFLATPGPAFDVTINAQGTHAYLAEGYQSTNGELSGGGLRIIDVADPTAPVEVGFYDTPGQALSIAIAEPYAYVGNADVGLVAVDVSKPDNPVEAGTYRPRGPVSAVDLQRKSVYLVDSWGGSLRIVDVSDPAAPTEAGFYYTFGLAEGVDLAGDYAFVADSNGELHVLDVSTRSAPTEAGFAEVAGTAADVAVSDNHVYVAAGDEGMFVFKFDAPEPTPTPASPTPAPLPTEPPASLHHPEGTFAELWASDEALRRNLGWATEPQPAEVATAFQPFEGGAMIWRGDERVIYVLFRDGSWRTLEDTWTEDQPARDPTILAPEERYQPIRGFGKVWREHREVRGRLGWALRPERGYTSPIQLFERGTLIGIDEAVYGLVEVAGAPSAWFQR